MNNQESIHPQKQIQIPLKEFKSIDTCKNIFPLQDHILSQPKIINSRQKIPFNQNNSLTRNFESKVKYLDRQQLNTSPSSLESFSQNSQINNHKFPQFQSPLTSKSSSQNDIYNQIKNLHDCNDEQCLKHSLSQSVLEGNQHFCSATDHSNFCNAKYHEFLKSLIQNRNQEISSTSYTQSGSIFSKISPKSKDLTELRKRCHLQPRDGQSFHKSKC